MYHRRAALVAFCVLLLFFGVVCRLYFIQVLQYRKFAGLKEKQYIQTVEIKPKRGTIFDCQGRELALSVDVDSVCAFPRQIENVQETAAKLAKALDLDQEVIKEKLKTDKYFVWIDRKIDAEQAKAVKLYKLKGVGFVKESKRCYPDEHLANQLLGFVGIDNDGLTGIEKYYDEYIKGESSFVTQGKDAKGRSVLNDTETCYNSSNSNDLILTIDKTIQYIAERELDAAWAKYSGRNALIIVQKTKTGEILALAGRPTFSYHKIKESSISEMRLRAITDFYEPGSTFKIITAAAALEEKVVKPEDRYFCENGSYKVGPTVIRDHEKEGWLTFAQVVERSSNIGTAKVANKIGRDKLFYYSKMFGFGSMTGIGLPGEIQGLLRKPKDWSSISLGRISFGQEIGVTPLQLLNAVNAVANGGMLMQPMIVKAIRNKQGTIIKEYDPQIMRKVISPETAQTLTTILQGVVENGTGAMAQVKGYDVAGKTGTAQKIDPSIKKYSDTKYVASFVGYLPADDPEVTILVIIDEPKEIYWGGSVCAPVFANVARDIMRYLNIPAKTTLLASNKKI
ncbi:MAG: penicillin-binding transpeptidase domain-containing protein [bacterium]|nr:penicillin-binding transpeptidase domain-containing protein [bacterium]MDD5755928.1 penicillin-binding transpeptidase domain-containing protein [bacterium]